MMRQHTAPYLTTAAGTLPLKVAQHNLSEEWLQDFIFTHPECLPVAEIEPLFSKLVPLCRELITGAGPIDLVFINQTGLITLVECKLWRNPQSRREAVGQILDYAKEVSLWGYEELERAVRAKTQATIYESVAQNVEELDEQQFIDDVSRNLRRGRFLLLIVGDGIREGVERMAEFLQQHGHLSFALALVELAIFSLPAELSSGYLVQPRIIAQTVEVERAVIRVEQGQVRVEAPKIDQALPASRRHKLSESAFYEHLEPHTAAELRAFLEKAQQLGLYIEAGQDSLMLKYAVEDSDFNFGIFRRNGDFYNFNIAARTSERGYPEIGDHYLMKLAKIFGSGYILKGPNRSHWTVKRSVKNYFTIAECLQAQNEWLALIQHTVEQILQAEEQR
jgi:hypothetical protein